MTLGRHSMYYFTMLLVNFFLFSGQFLEFQQHVETSIIFLAILSFGVHDDIFSPLF